MRSLGITELALPTGVFMRPEFIDPDRRVMLRCNVGRCSETKPSKLGSTTQRQFAAL